MFALIMAVAVMFSGCATTGPGRVVLAEEFTATWCGYCPKAAEALDKLAKEFPGRLVVVAYHSDRLGDPYGFAEGLARTDYYKVDGLPAVFLDGKGVNLGNGEEEDLSKIIRPALEPLLNMRPALQISVSYDEKDKSALVNLSNPEKLGKFVVRVAVVTPVAKNKKKDYFSVARTLSTPVIVEPKKKNSKCAVVVPITIDSAWYEGDLQLVAWAEDAGSGEVLATSFVMLPEPKP